MSGRRARLRALAKINLDLRVLEARPDGYHELRTVFQTISLADALEVGFTPARRTVVSVACDVEIAGQNLVERAAHLALEAMGTRGRVEVGLRKRIPVGAGLGGGSSDAAATLLALPVLAGRRLGLEKLIELGACLGSDVPFFLLGGTAVALGRGTELYPLPDRPAVAYGLVVAPGIHVSTAEAYRELDRRRSLTSAASQSIISDFQSCVWERGGSVSAAAGRNDFETVVFARHPRLRTLKHRLESLGAEPAMLSGSGSALWGMFSGRQPVERARAAFGKEQAFAIRVVTRARYRELWWRQLGAHIAERVWPPQSRYE